MKKYFSKMTALVLSALMLINAAAPAFAQQAPQTEPAGLPANYTGVDYTGIQLDYVDYKAHLVAEKSIPVELVKYVRADGTVINGNAIPINENTFVVFRNGNREFSVNTKMLREYEFSHSENGAEYYMKRKVGVWAKQIETKFTVISNGKVKPGNAYDVLIWRGGNSYDIVNRERFLRIYEQYAQKTTTSELKPIDFIKERPAVSHISEIKGLFAELNKINKGLPERKSLAQILDFYRTVSLRDFNPETYGEDVILRGKKWHGDIERISQIKKSIIELNTTTETKTLVNAEIKNLPKWMREGQYEKEPALKTTKIEGQKTYVFERITALRKQLGKNNSVIKKIIGSGKKFFTFGAEPKVKTAKPGSLLAILEKYVKGVEKIDAKAKTEIAGIVDANPSRTMDLRGKTSNEFKTSQRWDGRGNGEGVKAGTVAMVGGMVVLIIGLSIHQVWAAPSSYTSQNFAALNVIDLEAEIETETKGNSVTLPVALALGLINENSAERILDSVPNSEEVLEVSSMVAAYMEYALDNPEVLNEIKREVRLEDISEISNGDLAKYKNSANNASFGNYIPQKRQEK